MRILALLALALGLFVSPSATAAMQPETQMAYRDVLRQGDEPWRSIVLGGNLRVGAFGCAVFALRDALEEFGYRHQPAEFVGLLQSNAMLPSGRLRLGDVSRLYPDLVSERLDTPTGAAALSEARRLTNEGARVLLRLDRGVRSHWVFLSPRLAIDGSTLVRDPAYGTEVVFDALYTPEQIDGLTVIRRVPLPTWVVAS